MITVTVTTLEETHKLERVHNWTVRDGVLIVRQMNVTTGFPLSNVREWKEEA